MSATHVSAGPEQTLVPIRVCADLCDVSAETVAGWVAIGAVYAEKRQRATVVGLDDALALNARHAAGGKSQ
jgi:hypothetical protein